MDTGLTEMMRSIVEAPDERGIYLVACANEKRKTELWEQVANVVLHKNWDTKCNRDCISFKQTRIAFMVRPKSDQLRGTALRGYYIDETYFDPGLEAEFNMRKHVGVKESPVSALSVVRGSTGLVDPNGIPFN